MKWYCRYISSHLGAGICFPSFLFPFFCSPNLLEFPGKFLILATVAKTAAISEGAFVLQVLYNLI